MFLLLESKNQISAAQRTLEATIRRDFNNRSFRSIGYPGGTNADVMVQTNGCYWHWSADNFDSDQQNPRRLNWFGLFRENSTLNISVEINTPYEGKNKNVAGFFGRDTNSGFIYLLHSGRIGGGTKGVGKSAFLTWSGLTPLEVLDSTGTIREGVLVMPIKGASAIRSLTRYINKVAEFKEAVRKGQTNTKIFKRKQKEFEDFYGEPHGLRKVKGSSKTEYLSRHGEVLDALHDFFKDKRIPNGGRLVKNILIDLGVAKGRALIHVFEIKTSTMRSDIYSAIGQLMVHGITKKCKRTVVLPYGEPIPDDLVSALKHLGIQIFRFKLDTAAGPRIIPAP